MQDVEHPHTARHSIAIKTEVFEGPLELLIELIEKRKLLINDISLAAVTDEFMQRVALMERNPLPETTHFVALASTLLLIKSKSLLPILELTQEEEESIEDLQERLRLYQIYRRAGKILSEAFGSNISFGRQFLPDSTPMFITDRFTDVSALRNAMYAVVENLPKKVVKPKVQVRQVVSLEEMIDRLRERIERQMRFNFKDFTGGGAERTTVIVGFLAVLEMVKQGTVMVTQMNRFEDISIEREDTGIPRYI